VEGNVDIQVQTVLSQNITLVYNSLDLQTIDSSSLKELMGVQTKSMLMDTPEMIVEVYPPEPTFIQMGDRRIRITLPQLAKDIGGVPLWEVVVKCARLVPASKSTLIAYGFNYDVKVALAGRNAQQVTIDLFAANPQMLDQVLDGHLLSFAPRLKFQRGHTHYDLMIEPTDEQHVKVHMNSHFGFSGIALPPKNIGIWSQCCQDY
jgi:hypothetical protein